MLTIIHRFLFRPVNARSVALLRISLGVAIPIFFFSEGLKLTTFNNISELVWLYDNLILAKLYFCFILLLSFILIAGWKPRLTSFVLFIILIPLVFLSRGNQSRQIILFVLISFSFIRCETVFSLLNYKSSGHSNQNEAPIWPVRLMQIQLSLVYFVNALAKSTSSYLSGDVLTAMSIANPKFLVDLSSGYFNLAGINIPVMVLSILTVVVEYYLSLGFWIRRILVITIIVGIGFHMILKFIIDIHMLDYASMFLYLTFILPLENQYSLDSHYDYSNIKK